jgi:hypothetical protein
MGEIFGEFDRLRVQTQLSRQLIVILRASENLPIFDLRIANSQVVLIE